jgi:hypothetical protein
MEGTGTYRNVSFSFKTNAGIYAGLVNILLNR